MKQPFLIAVLCVGTITGCSDDADPLAPSTELAATPAGPAGPTPTADPSALDDLEDAHARIAAAPHRTILGVTVSQDRILNRWPATGDRTNDDRDGTLSGGGGSTPASSPAPEALRGST